MARATANQRQFNARRTAAGLASATALLTIVALPAAEARTVLAVGPLVGTIEDDLQGAVCQVSAGCVIVPSRSDTEEAVAEIDTAIRSTFEDHGSGADPGGGDDGVLVFGYSHGASMTARWLAEHAGKPDAPSPDELSLLLIGNPTRKYGGSEANGARPFVMPETDYPVIDLVRQYDMAADYPDRPNLLAILNVISAFFSVHMNYEAADLDNPANIVWTEGNTTYVFVPTPKLPLLDGLRNFGLSGLADVLNEPLKRIVERAYDRSYLPTALPEQPGSAAARSSISAAADQPEEMPEGLADAAAPDPEPVAIEPPETEVKSTAQSAEAETADTAELLGDERLPDAPEDTDADQLAVAELANPATADLGLQALEEALEDEIEGATDDEAAADEPASRKADTTPGKAVPTEATIGETDSAKSSTATDVSPSIADDTDDDGANGVGDGDAAEPRDQAERD